MPTETLQNGTVLPISARDTFEVQSQTFEGVTYRLKTLTYHGKTQLTSAMIRSGIEMIGASDMREELRRYLLHAPPSQEHSDALALLDAAEAGEEWTEEDSALIRRIEAHARQTWPRYAEMFAAQYAWSRYSNWETVRRTLCAIEGGNIPWNLDYQGLPTDDTLEYLGEADIALLAIEAKRLAEVDTVTAKNSDSPST